MTIQKLRVALVAAAFGAVVGAAAVAQQPEPMASAPPMAADPIASAQSAAPASISSKATIDQMDGKGATTVLRKGTNGWTCMPDSTTTTGPDPM